MPRIISAPALAKVTQQYGAEPINILEIQWVEGGQRHRYADRDIPSENIKGRIHTLDGLDAVIQVSSGGDSSELSVVLSDIDDEIKNIIDTNDIHKRPCWVYQWFEGIDYSEKFLLFNGQINSHPMTWNEGDRTVAFDIVNKIEDVEIGFSIEEGDFDDPPEELIGKPWPLCFGTCINVPALRAKSSQKGTLAQGVGIRDPTLVHRLAVAQDLICPLSLESFTIHYGSTPSTNSISASTDPECARRKCETIQSLELQFDEQGDFEFETFTVYGGDKFPQNTDITLDINGGKFFGRMNGETFTCTGRRHPQVEADGDIIFDNEAQNVVESECGSLVFGLPAGSFDFDILAQMFDPEDAAAGIRNVNEMAKAQNLHFLLTHATITSGNITSAGGNNIYRGFTQMAAKSEISFKFFNALPTLSFFWANAGSEVTLDSRKEIIYIANILPSTILRVAAYRTVDAGRLLVTVPPSFYTVRTVDYNTYDVVEIVLDRPLSGRNQGWEDDIYVTLESTVGPNTVDILEWIIETYTDFTIDATSFNDVRTKIDNYPSSFPILSRPNVVKILQDIAYQARCALWLRDDVFYIKYLAEEPTPDESVNVSEMEEKSFELFHTETEDLVTKYVAEWQRDYALEDKNKLILRHNVKKYGTHEETTDFFIYNILELVRKSATFWLIRKSNTWRKVRFRTHFNKLKLETFDTVTVDHPALADLGIPCTIEKANFDSAERRMEFECWTPCLSGTRVAYDFAWPSQIEEKLLWPTVDERLRGFAGSGREPNFSVFAPNDHPLANVGGGTVQFQCSNGQSIPPGAEISKFCRGDHGDNKPSDIGDTKPEPPVQTGGGEVNGGTDPTKSKPQDCCALAQQALDLARKALTESGKLDQNQSDPDDELDNLPEKCGGNCTALVRIQSGIPTVVHGPVGSFPYFKNEDGDSGVIVAIENTKIECHTFNSATAAHDFAQQKNDEFDAKNNSFAYVVGEEAEYQVTQFSPNLGTDRNPKLPDGSDNPNYNQPCEEPDEADWKQVGYTSTPSE